MRRQQAASPDVQGRLKNPSGLPPTSLSKLEAFKVN